MFPARLQVLAQGEHVTVVGPQVAHHRLDFVQGLAQDEEVTDVFTYDAFDGIDTVQGNLTITISGCR